MELEVKRQLLQLVAAYAAGLGLGVIYDVLRAIRRRLGLNWFFDLLFAGALGFVLCTLGMSVGDGELNLFMAGFAALGFYTYMRLLSRLFLPAFAAFTGLLALILRPFRIVGKFFADQAKNVFSNCRAWFTMKRKSDRDSGGDAIEAEAAYDRRGGDCGAADICGVESCGDDGRSARRKRYD